MNVVRIEERAPVRAGASGADPAVSPGARARLLMREAQAAAVEELEVLEGAIRTVRNISLEVLDGGDAYGAGVRDLAARLAEDLLWRGKSLEAFIARERARLQPH